MTEFEVYLWLILDNVSFVCAGLAAFLFIVSACLTFMTLTSECECHGLLVWVITIPMMLLAILTPTTKQYAVIKVLPKIVNSEIMKEVPEDMKEMYSMSKEYIRNMFVEKGNGLKSNGGE